ncbi:MAG: hypothetical protein QOE45_2817 [Frankiaceae bacterium]|nr:hypothetical protein [Frankiaceae bacterium]
MNGMLRTLVLVAWPHGGQRGSRTNALAALREARAACAEQAAAAAAFDHLPARHAVSR